MPDHSADLAPRQRAIAFMAWGEEYIGHIASCIRESMLPDYPIHVITDHATPVDALPDHVSVTRKDLGFEGKTAKLRMLADMPAHLDTVVFLDVDTRVLADITLGFDKAERHGIAMAPAPHYSLEHFRNFGTVMDREGVPRLGQMLYNSGVLFFDPRNPEVRAVFALACEIASKDEIAPWGDQTYITLAMEKLGFNPYTLSASFNHRAFGELISGSLRIWHSYKPVPDAARELPPGYLYRFPMGRMIRAMRVPK